MWHPFRPAEPGTKTRIEHYRPGTGDDKWVIPELVDQDMYRMSRLCKLVSGYSGDVIDCGAHIGVFTVLMAEGCDRKIHSFEPTKANFALLEKNVERFGERVSCYKRAVALDDGVLRMTELSHNIGNYSSSPTGDGEEVEAISLPAFIESLGSVALIKLDLEGAEAAIINETDPEILRRVGVLVLEEHDVPIDYPRLKSMGFQLAYRPMRSKRHGVFQRRG
jgi:FkbM family methyltransferase